MDVDPRIGWDRVERDERRRARKAALEEESSDRPRYRCVNPVCRHVELSPVFYGKVGESESQPRCSKCRRWMEKI